MRLPSFGKLDRVAHLARLHVRQAEEDKRRALLLGFEMALHGGDLGRLMLEAC